MAPKAHHLWHPRPITYSNRHSAKVIILVPVLDNMPHMAAHIAWWYVAQWRMAYGCAGCNGASVWVNKAAKGTLPFCASTSNVLGGCGVWDFDRRLTQSWQCHVASYSGLPVTPSRIPPRCAACVTCSSSCIAHSSMFFVFRQHQPLLLFAL